MEAIKLRNISKSLDKSEGIHCNNIKVEDYNGGKKLLDKRQTWGESSIS